MQLLEAMNKRITIRLQRLAQEIAPEAFIESRSAFNRRESF